jgi:hypothetical protein
LTSRRWALPLRHHADAPYMQHVQNDSEDHYLSIPITTSSTRSRARSAQGGPCMIGPLVPSRLALGASTAPASRRHWSNTQLSRRRAQHSPLLLGPQLPSRAAAVMATYSLKADVLGCHPFALSRHQPTKPIWGSSRCAVLATHDLKAEQYPYCYPHQTKGPRSSLPLG